MLKIRSRSASAIKIYHQQNLERNDYYFKGENEKNLEIVGKWNGKTAELLGLEGKVTKKDFHNLADNINPQTGERLTARTGAADKRISAYDFTFSAKKDISILYEMTGDERLLKAHNQAIQETMEEIERAVETRIRGEGIPDHNIVSGNMLWADFDHSTTRPTDGIPDMHMHGHRIAMNVTYNEQEKRFKAFNLREIVTDSPYYDAAYDSRLAQSVTEMGYEVERRGKSWGIKGISREMVEMFSNRTDHIDKTAIKLGIYSDKLKDSLGSKTAEKKTDEFSRDELRGIWRDRMGEDGYSNIQSLYQASLTRTRKLDTVAMKEQAEKSVLHALEHSFERENYLDEARFKAVALKHGVGKTSVEHVQEALKHTIAKNTELQKYQEDVVKPFKGQSQRYFFSTKTAVKTDKNIVSYVNDGKNTKKSFASNLPDDYAPDYTTEDGKELNKEQVGAVEHVLNSNDSVIGIQGGAGVGKTSLMRKTIDAIELSGKQTYVFAPSSEAAFDVLRKKEGFTNANTIQKLLGDSKEAADMREAMQNQAVWIDEASLLSSKQMNSLFDIAGKQNTRVILSGDVRQHSSVERGQAYRLLQKKGMDVAEVREIQRQRGNKDYKQAVKAISGGKIAEGFQKLDDMGSIVEIKDEPRQGEAKDSRERKNEMIFEEVKQSVNNRQSFLIVAPTHAEGNDITASMREAMKKEGMIGKKDSIFTTLRSSNLTEAELKDVASYKQGDVVQFHQNVKGIKRGSKLNVSAVGEDSVTVTGEDGLTHALPLDKAGNFQLYNTQEKAFTKGDKIRVTQGSYFHDGKGRHRLNNGSIHDIAGIRKNGEIELANGWTLPKNFGHMTHGYVTTSHASQGKTVDNVLVSQSSQSFMASYMEQFYVSVSRGKKSVKIFTDDKEELLKAVSRSGERETALERTERSKRIMPVDTQKKMIDRYNNLARYVEILAYKARDNVSNFKQQIPYFNVANANNPKQSAPAPKAQVQPPPRR